jgi:hypothetical protein
MYKKDSSTRQKETTAAVDRGGSPEGRSSSRFPAFRPLNSWFSGFSEYGFWFLIKQNGKIFPRHTKRPNFPARMMEIFHFEG